MVNSKFLETTGSRESEVLGQLYQKAVLWKKTEADSCPINAVLTHGEPVTVSECLDSDSDTTPTICFERHFAPILDEDGQVEFIIEAVRDITSEKLLKNEQMEKMKLQGVVEMAGTAAHELNTPLFAALGTAQLLRDDLDSEELIEEMDVIIRNMKKMGELTREMTTVTGFEAREYVGDTKIVKLKSNNKSKLAPIQKEQKPC